jgi:predicted thioesterase
MNSFVTAITNRVALAAASALILSFLHVDSRTIGQCVAMRHLMLTVDPDRLKAHYAAMPEEVRRDNDLGCCVTRAQGHMSAGATGRACRVSSHGWS